MDEMKLKLTQAVGARLSAAPASKEKDELIEELSDNLYRRFLEMNGAGVPEEEAFRRSMDDLGDVDELLAYLGVEPAGDVTIDRREGQTRITTKDGQKVIINGGDDEDIVINAGDGAAQPQDDPQGQPDGQGDVHYSYDSGTGQSDLDAILANVGEICRTAMDQVKEAARQAKDAIQRRTTVEKDNRHVRVHFNTRPDETVPPEPTEPSVPPEPPVPPTPPESPKGWEFEAELDSDQGRFFAGAGPRERKDVVYGFGYDKAKGGFFAQWGEYKDERSQGPRFTGSDSQMEHQEDGSYSVTALKDLRGIEVHTGAGDVTVHVSEAPDAGVIIDGDVDDLDVTCSADGVLTIREGRTASSSFFSRRGFASSDVELFLPSRHWETISITTGSGDVDFDRDGLDIDQLSVSTGSGDLSVRLSACGQFNFRSGSGDVEVDGSCARLRVETTSGDISLRGDLGQVTMRTASGDIELHGAAGDIRADAVSGDVEVETSRFPGALELSSKSGDVEARIPDGGPFILRMKTVSGEMSCSFPVNYVNGVCVYGDGSGPAYSITSVSGDVSLERC